MAYSVSYSGSNMDTILTKGLTFEDKNEAWVVIPSNITTLDISKVLHSGNYIYTGILSLPAMEQLYGYKTTTAQDATTVNCTCMIFVRRINQTIYQFISTRGIQDNADKTMGIAWINNIPKVFFLSEESNTMMAIVAGESADKGIHKFNNQIRVFKDTKMIKYYDQISDSYKQIIMDMMPKSIYGDISNFFSFVDANVTEKYAKFKTHTQDNVVHITSANKTSYDSKYHIDLLESDIITRIDTFFTELDIQISNVKNTITTIQNKVSSYATSLSNHNNNTTLHPTQSQIDSWDSKKDAVHTHTTDEITIDAANVTGILSIDQIPDTAKERMKIVSSYTEMMNLTESDVQDGDWIYINDTKYPLLYVVDSTNGINWTEGTISDTSREWTSVCYGNGKFVTVAYNSNYFAYSTDGINWTEGTISSTSRYWQSVCYGNGKFVVVADDTYFAYSTDGINWTEGTISNTSRNWWSICYGNGKFVAVAYDTYFAYSTDGINWTESTISITSRLWRSVCYGNGKYVAVAINSNYFAYSTDGITWMESTISNTSRNWSSVCYGNGKFVTVGGNLDSDWNLISGNDVAYSTDGITWTESTISSTSRYWYSVCYGNGKYVAVAGGTKYFAYSTDGINWTEGTVSSTSREWTSVCYGNGKFVAVTYDDNYFAYLTNYIQLNTKMPELTWDNVQNKPITYDELNITDDMSNDEVNNLQSNLNTELTTTQSSLDTLTQKMSIYSDDRIKSTHILETSIDAADQKLTALYNLTTVPEKIISVLEQVLV